MESFWVATCWNWLSGMSSAPGQMVDGPFVGLAHVDEAELAACGEPRFEFLGGDVHGW